MNFLEAVEVIADRVPITEEVLLRDALDQVLNVMVAYDLLRPDWNEAPDWATWYSITDDLKGVFLDAHPDSDDVWRTKVHKYYSEDDVPLGIDFRLCCWYRGRP